MPLKYCSWAQSDVITDLFVSLGRDSLHHSINVVPIQNTRYLSHYPPKKRFTVNGAITSLTSPGYYFVDPAEENRRILLPGIYNGAFLMLYGPRGSGKSTRVYRAIEQLSNDFCCLGVTFQNGVDFRSLDLFWKTFGGRLLENYPSIFKDKLPFSSASEFSSMFKASNKETLFGGKNVVLFVDEFDRLYQAPQQVIDSMLDTLRGLKQERVAYCLQSFVGIGPFSILALTGKSSSPFNVRDTVQVRYWTREEVHQLFSQYSTTIDRKIVDDIYERTAGHPGLVCLCGKIIDEKQNMLSENYDLWLQYATTKLEKAVIEWPTMQKMVETLSSLSENIKLARILLRQRFIPNTISPIVLNTQEELNRGKFLAAEGALIPVDLSTFRIPSPMVHRLLLERVLTIDKRAKIPSEAVPFITSLHGTTIDVQKLITTTIAYIEPSIIQAAFRRAYKKSRLPGMKRDSFVPQEAVYHAELFAILRDWLPSDVTLLTQVNLPSLDSNSRSTLR